MNDQVIIEEFSSLVGVDFSKLEEKVMANLTASTAQIRGQSKSWMFGAAYGRLGHKKSLAIFDDFFNAYNGHVSRVDYGTVARAFAELPGTRMTTLEDGDDPLFEAMERHKHRVQAGKKALAVLFKAQALPVYTNQTNGPTKPKDWEK